ncbi:MAG: hypothetical protein AB9873_08115 [Syntrophobacteraceae bacterium]
MNEMLQPWSVTMNASEESTERSKGTPALALSPQHACILWQPNALVIEDHAEMAFLAYQCASGTELRERICSYLKRLAEIRREELALRDRWHDLLMRIEVGGDNG